MKFAIKNLVVRLLAKIIIQPSMQSTLAEQHRNYGQDIPKLSNDLSPYYSYNLSSQTNGEGSVFITGRFRSGSTLLWNVFRKSEEFTAYYEPFNERQWFNPVLRGEGVDKTHRGVENYWLEYDGLEDLSQWYEEDWIREKLYMSASADEPKMRKFIDRLISNAKGRPVLQFNRIDFRLPWLRQQYPKAKFVHLYRNPRDQWCSFLTDKKLMNKDDLERTYLDYFYVGMWCEDLAKHFPFLSQNVTSHPYKRFYYLWKLSYIFGKKYADVSLSYEDFVSEPTNATKKLREVILADETLVSIAESLISVTSIGAWTDYAEASWFLEKETECEDVLTSFFKASEDI